VRHLLDTHALLWYVLNDPQLSTTATRTILDPANDILVSPVSFWEIAIKVSIGKYTLTGTHEQFVEECLQQYRLSLLPVAPAHTSRVAVLPYFRHHKDPFDRMLVAQVLTEGIPLVSADDKLDAYGITRVW